MGKGCKIFRGKGGQIPDSQRDMFEEELEDDPTKEVSSDEEEQEEQDNIEISEVFLATEDEPPARDLTQTHVTREESPVIEAPRTKRGRTERKYASLTAAQ